MKTICAMFAVLLFSGFLYAQAPSAAQLRRPGGAKALGKNQQNSALNRSAAEPSTLSSCLDIRREINSQLLSGKRNLVQWASELVDKEPQDPKAAVIKIHLMLRAGLDSQAAKTVAKLKSLCQSKDNHVLQSVIRDIYYHSAEMYHSSKTHQGWKTALAVVESFPEYINDWGIANSLTKYLQKDGWDDDQLDQWLKKIVRRATKNAPPSEFWRSRYYEDQPDVFWIKVRAQHLKKLGKEASLIAALEEEAREDPTNSKKMLDYLNVRHLIYPPNDQNKTDLSWIADVFRPKDSSAAFLVARQLKRSFQWKPAAKLYQLALDIPFDKLPVDITQTQAYQTSDQQQYNYLIAIREELAECLVKLKQPQKAQAMLNEAVKLRKKRKGGRLSLNLHVTGEVHAASGSSEVEKQILKEEKNSKDDPKYWLKRANYYKISKRVKEAEQAYRKGLEIAKPAPRPRGKAMMNPRARLIGGFVNFLMQNQRKDDAFKLLHDEIKTASADSWSAEVAAFLLVSQRNYSFRDYLLPDEPTLLQWLEKRPVWHYQETCVLNYFAEMAQQAQDLEKEKLRSKVLQRIEKMVKDAHPSRAICLGELLLSSRRGNPDPEKAIPYLQYALKHKDSDKNLRQQAASKLFTAYTKSGDIKRASKMFNESSSEFNLSSCDPLNHLALLAAKQGDKEMAMENWRRSANCSLNNKMHHDLTSKLRRLGLGDQIDAYYREVKEKLPEFTCPSFD